MQDAKEVVSLFLKALNDENFSQAASYLAEDMKFEGVLGTRDNAADYMKDMERMKFKYNIQKVFADGNDVAVFYDIDMSGTKVFCSGWYHLAHGKISAFKVIFDPRKILEASPKK